ncbi:zinc finger domain-containing protein [Streptomyces xanthophaeus]
MTKPRSAPMPAALRAGRPPRHPALAVRCPHCSAAPDLRCTTRTVRLDPCPARLAAHAVAVAVCPDCQVAPGYPCHDGGIQRPDSSPVHARRYEEARGMAA